MIGEETFHPDTRALLAYGRALAGQADWPHKGVAPKDQPSGAKGADRLAERLFVFDRLADGRMLVRTFGTELVTLFGNDLRDRDFFGLWPDADQALLRAFVVAVEAAGQPGIVRAEAESALGRRLGAEILIAPLRTAPSMSDRYLGLFQPLGGEAFLAGEALVRLRLGSIHPPPARETLPPLRLVVKNG